MEKNELLQLPVFQISGGTEPERNRFAEELVQGLEVRSFRSALLESNDSDSPDDLYRLAKTHDIVLATSGLPWPVQQIEFEVGARGDIQKCLADLIQRLTIQTPKNKVWACVLIGGKSSRMGQPKHLIKGENGKTWLENSIELLLSFVDGVVIAGKGDIPSSLTAIPRLPDVPGVVGPLAGFLSACRWQPLISWLLLACDMPLVSKEAVAWLLGKRRAGAWGIVPVLGKGERYEPLFAYYDYRCGPLFEKQVLAGNVRISKIGTEDKVSNPIVPPQLHHCWENVNTPEQLKGTLAKAP